jgi:hypothetical protein
MTTDQLEKPKQQEAPTPDPSLERLSKLVGTWELEGQPLGSDQCSIRGTTRFKWLHDPQGRSFFLQQDMAMDYDGKQIKSHELIGYDPKTKAFSSFVYSNMAPDAWPYNWDVHGDDITISIKKPPMDATFKGKFAQDGNSFSGGWRPNPGADEMVNTSYDVTATRVAD